MRPHLAAVVEELFETWLAQRRRRQGWREQVISYTGYGSAVDGRDVARVLGRVVLVEPSPTHGPEAAADATATEAELDQAQGRRGWRDFLATPAGFARITVTVGDASVTTSSDRSGYVDVELHGHGLDGGWHEAEMPEDATALDFRQAGSADERRHTLAGKLQRVLDEERKTTVGRGPDTP